MITFTEHAANIGLALDIYQGPEERLQRATLHQHNEIIATFIWHKANEQINQICGVYDHNG